jgi:hypothetical protein
MEMQGFMRYVILVIIALMALGGLLPAVMSLPSAPFNQPLTQLTTPSMSAFLNDSWTPSTFVAPLASDAALFTKKSPSNNTTANSTYAAYDFLNSNNTTSTAEAPNITTAAPGKDSNVAWTGESIYQFADDSWTPSTPIAAYNQGAYKLHQMN